MTIKRQKDGKITFSDISDHEYATLMNGVSLVLGTKVELSDEHRQIEIRAAYVMDIEMGSFAAVDYYITRSDK